MTGEIDYDVILMDVQMPGMDGFAATAAIPREGRLRHVPIIAMTAHAIAETASAARRKAWTAIYPSRSKPVK